MLICLCCWAACCSVCRKRRLWDWLFGLASMWKAGASYVMPFDQLFSPFMSGRPAQSLLLSVGARVLFGAVAGLLYLAAKRLPCPGFWVCLVSFFGKTLHSFLVYGAMGIFLPGSRLSGGRRFRFLLDLERSGRQRGCRRHCFLFWRLERSRFWRDYCEKMEKARTLRPGERYHRLSLAVILILAVCLAVAVAVYFVQRTDFVLEKSGILLSDTNYADLLHLQIQFVIGIFAMMWLVVIFLIFNRRHTTYLNYEARTDPVTGMMGRKAFFQGLRRPAACRRENGIFYYGGRGLFQKDQRPVGPSGRRPGFAGNCQRAAAGFWRRRDRRPG